MLNQILVTAGVGGYSSTQCVSKMLFELFMPVKQWQFGACIISDNTYLGSGWLLSAPMVTVEGRYSNSQDHSYGSLF